jgi:hypothetical protein
MASPALEVSAEINNDAHTGNEYMKKKQRTDASEVTNPCSWEYFVQKICLIECEGCTLFYTLARSSQSGDYCKRRRTCPCSTSVSNKSLGHIHLICRWVWWERRLSRCVPYTFRSDTWVRSNFKKSEVQKSVCIQIQYNFVYLGPAVETGVDPASWFDFGVSYASASEVLLVSFGTCLPCIRYAQPQERSDRLLQGRRKWLTGLSRAWSEMVPSGLVAVYPPVSTRTSKTANHRRHEHATQTSRPTDSHRRKPACVISLRYFSTVIKGTVVP